MATRGAGSYERDVFAAVAGSAFCVLVVLLALIALLVGGKEALLAALSVFALAVLACFLVCAHHARRRAGAGRVRFSPTRPRRI